MKRIVCEMCGSTDIVKQDGLFVCRNCGIKYSSQEAKKLMIEVTGKVDISGSTVKIDDSKRLSNLLESARTATKNKNYKEASRKWEEIHSLDPNSWEACYFSSVCDSLTNDYGLADYKVIKSTFKQTVGLIKKHVSNKRGQLGALRVVIDSIPAVIQPSIDYWEWRDRENEEFHRKYPLSDYSPASFSKAQSTADAELWFSLGDTIKTAFRSDVDCLELAYTCYQNGSRKFGLIVPKEYRDKTDQLAKVIEIKSKEREEQEEKKRQKKSEAFWAKHPAEKEALLKERTSLLEEIQTLAKSIEVKAAHLEKEKEGLNNNEELTRIVSEIQSLIEEKQSLSILKIREKRELSLMIEELENKRREKRESLNVEIEKIDKKIERLIVI